MVVFPVSLAYDTLRYKWRSSSGVRLFSTTPHLHIILTSESSSYRMIKKASVIIKTDRKHSLQSVMNVHSSFPEGWRPLLPGFGHFLNRDHIIRSIEKEDLDPNSTNDIGQTVLSWAAEKGKQMVVEALLDHGVVDLDKRDKDGRTPLFWAAESGHEEIARLLIERKTAHLDIPNVHGQTPLSNAAKHGYEAIVALLLREAGVKVNSKDKDGWTPLMHATGHVEDKMNFNYRGDSLGVVKVLLRYGAEPDVADKQGRTPLSRAIECGKIDVVRYLIDDGRSDKGRKDSSGRSPLSWASGCGHCMMVELLLGYNIIPDSTDNEGRTPLWWATKNGHGMVIRTILRGNQDSLNYQDLDGRTPLSCAAEHGKVVALKELLSYPDIDPNLADKSGQTPLTWAAKGGQASSVKLLLLESTEIRPDSPDRDGRTPLSRAAEYGHKEVMKMLLDKETVDLNAKDKDGRSPLWWAADGNHESAVKLLLAERNIDSAPVTKDDQTPLVRAVELGHNDVVKHLIRKDTLTVHLLARKRNLPLVKSLLELNCKIDGKNNLNQTPLHVAALEGDLNIAKQLVLKGADVESKDIRGMTPLRLAVQRKHPDLIEMLLQSGAQAIGIMGEDWRKAYGSKTSHVGLVFLQKSGQTTSLHFPKHLADVPVELEQRRSLLHFEDYSTWMRSVNCNTFATLQLNEGPISYETKKHDRHDSITVACRYPISRSSGISLSFQISDWGRCGISWTVVPPTATWKSIEHTSTLPYGWIPEDGASFLALFVEFLKKNWVKTCTEAENHLDDRRLKQLEERGKNPEFISYLAEDAKTWAQLRTTLRNQIRGIRSLVTEYHGSYNKSSVPEHLQKEIDSFGAEVNDQVNQLEKTVKDLLDFEFSWASINEAHRSTSIATSIKRLSWITFIFLPAMFASSLFGMNVNILESNPDWRWYLVFGLGFIAITFFVWLVIKYGQLEESFERYIGARLQRSLDRRKKSDWSMHTTKENSHEHDC